MLDRVDLARALLSAPAPPGPVGHLDSFPFPAGKAPVPQPIAPTPTRPHGPALDDPLPAADVAVVTWTAAEADALARVLTPKLARAHWYPYAHNWSAYRPNIRPGAPSLAVGRLGSYMPVTVGAQRVLCMKSELHLNQDGISQGPGLATLPVLDLWKQIIAETGAKTILTVGTAGATLDFPLGDAAISRAAIFHCKEEFANEPWNGQTFRSDWEIPTGYLDEAAGLMQEVAPDLALPKVAPPSPQYKSVTLHPPRKTGSPQIRLEGRDFPEFHPIVTTDYFEFGTTTNGLGDLGCAVEMGDAVLGLACSQLDAPPNWAAVRNMSDPLINGSLEQAGFHLDQGAMWATEIYTAYGLYTSIAGALATWGLIAGLA